MHLSVAGKPLFELHLLAFEATETRLKYRSNNFRDTHALQIQLIMNQRGHCKCKQFISGKLSSSHLIFEKKFSMICNASNKHVATSSNGEMNGFLPAQFFFEILNWLGTDQHTMRQCDCYLQFLLAEKIKLSLQNYENDLLDDRENLDE